MQKYIFFWFLRNIKFCVEILERKSFSKNPPLQLWSFDWELDGVNEVVFSTRKCLTFDINRICWGLWNSRSVLMRRLKKMNFKTTPPGHLWSFRLKPCWKKSNLQFWVIMNMETEVIHYYYFLSEKLNSQDFEASVPKIIFPRNLSLKFSNVLIQISLEKTKATVSQKNGCECQDQSKFDALFADFEQLLLWCKSSKNIYSAKSSLVM